MSNHKTRTIQGMAWSVQTLAAVAAVSLLAGCATTPPPEYQPRVPGGLVGYSDLELTPNRYRVSYSGGPASTRDDVEKYLLRRAAEVTLQTGHTHFVLTNRDTERDTYFGGDNYIGGPYYPYNYSYPYPYWYGNYNLGNGWYGWSANTYSAYAEIDMFGAEDSRRHPEAIDALNLLRRLQPPLPVASTANER